MALEKITTVSGKGVCVPGSDIDTDRIIPARFMKCVTFDGLGEYLFYDVRHDADGNLKDHPLNEDRFADASILLSGINFGCGSSASTPPRQSTEPASELSSRRASLKFSSATAPLSASPA